MTVSRSRDEDQQLESNVDDRLHRVRDRTISDACGYPSEWSVDPRQPVAGRSDRVLQRLVLQVSRN